MTTDRDLFLNPDPHLDPPELRAAGLWAASAGRGKGCLERVDAAVVCDADGTDEKAAATPPLVWS